jgi:endoglucanase
MDTTEKLLKILTETHGVPGHEEPIRAVLREYLTPLGSVQTDNLGSLICELPGAGPRIMLAAHMDEIGFMVNHITKEGVLKFIQLGGWFDQVLLGHRVIVKTHKGDLLGTIGAKPPHLLPPEARDKVVKKSDMYIDIGLRSDEEAKAAGVRMGDPVVPDSQFAVLSGGKSYLSKAFDDRVGCALIVDALQALKKAPSANKVYGVASVMEEVGSRGATTAPYIINPDIAIVLEAGIAGDVPGVTPEESAQKLGGGPVIGMYDARNIVHLKLRDLVYSTAEEMGVPLQPGFMPGGATDAAPIHLHHAGVPSVVLAVAARHIHSHNSIINRDDYDQTLKLLLALIRKLDENTVKSLRAF